MDLAEANVTLKAEDLNAWNASKERNLVDTVARITGIRADRVVVVSVMPGSVVAHVQLLGFSNNAQCTAAGNGLQDLPNALSSSFGTSSVAQQSCQKRGS